MVLDHIPTQRRGGDRVLVLKKTRVDVDTQIEYRTLSPNGLNMDYKIMPGM